MANPKLKHVLKYGQYRPRCECGYPLDDWGECGPCRTRKKHRLPADAKCPTCRYRTTRRCAFMGTHAVCASWCKKND